MSLSIDELSSIYGMYGVNGLSQYNTQAASSSEAEKKATDGDSYISTIADLDPNAAIPSENYNDLARQIKSAAGSSESANSTVYASVTDSLRTDADGAGTSAAGTSAAGSTDAATESVGGSGGSGGAGSSDSDEDTETEVVTIDGQTYLQTTTTDSNGNTTVTRTPIGAAPVDTTAGTSAAPSAAAQALAAL